MIAATEMQRSISALITMFDVKSKTSTRETIHILGYEFGFYLGTLENGTFQRTLKQQT